MILVTGTRGSGTPLWMEILTAAGFPLLPQAAARRFEGGVYFATNPCPSTGEYFLPEQVEHHAVRVEVPGLLRTDRAYLGKVIVTVSDHREYCRERARVLAIESATQAAAATGAVTRTPALPPALEWWIDAYAVIRDVAMRRYAAHVEAHGRLVSEPERVVGEVFAWLGRGDVERATTRVRPDARHVAPATENVIEPEFAAVFDELYACIETRRGLSPEFVGKLNDTHRALLPRIANSRS